GGRKYGIWRGRVGRLAGQGAVFGVITGPISTDMATVRQRKREMVNREIDLHLQSYKVTGAELIMGTGRFVAPRTLEARLNDGGTRVLASDRGFLSDGRACCVPRKCGLLS